MKNKKENNKGKEKDSTAENESLGQIASKTDLKNFLLNVRDKMTDHSAAPIYAMAALKHVLDMPGVYDLLDNENKEIARDIWLRLRQAGMQVRNPPLLFGADEDGLGASGR